MSRLLYRHICHTSDFITNRYRHILCAQTLQIPGVVDKLAVFNDEKPWVSLAPGNPIRSQPPSWGFAPVAGRISSNSLRPWNTSLELKALRQPKS